MRWNKTGIVIKVYDSREMANNSTVTTDHMDMVSDEFQIAEIVIFSFMLLACLFGNLLVLTVIISTKKLRTPANYLIANLAVCDMMCAVLAIPFTLILYNIIYSHKSFPYGYIGCKTLWPITTHASNGSVFTLVTISIERYVNMSSIRVKLTKKRILYVIILVHIFAFLLVVPYISHLTYIVVEGNAYCYEKWNEHWHQKYYTIALVCVQYILPLLIMTTFYSLSWRRLYTRNKQMIQMSEDYESKMTWRVQYGKSNGELLLTDIKDKNSNDKTCLIKSTGKERIRRGKNKLPDQTTDEEEDIERRGTMERIMEFHFANQEKPTRSRSLSLPSFFVRRLSKDKRMSVGMQYTQKRFDNRQDSADSISPKEMKRFRRSEYRSQAAFVRHRQSIRTLKMFTVVVCVFAIFSLPNQISWGLQIFDRIPPMVLDIFIMLTYISPVVNCWIYGGFNKGIRGAYIRHLRLPCHPCKSYREKTQSNVTNTSYISSYYDSRQENLYLRRQSAFSRMFRDHLENFDNFKHLYEKKSDIDTL